LYEWALMLDNDEMILKADWLKDIFKLTNTEINNIVGNQSYLYRFYQYFLSYLRYTFKCYEDQDCLNQLVYQQLFDGSVTNKLNIENIRDLYLQVNSTYYPFIKTPEIKNYFEKDFKLKMRELNNTRYENMTFDDMEIDLGIVKSLILGNSTSLLQTENSIDFIFYNYTKNLYSAYLKFNIQTLDQLFFFADYFTNFIPSVYLYPAFEVQKGNETHSYYGNKLSNAFVSLIPIVVNQSIEKIKNNIESVLIARIAYHKLKSEENIINCEDIFNDVTKNISDCLYSYCKEDEKNYIKSLSGLNDVILIIIILFTKICSF